MSMLGKKSLAKIVSSFEGTLKELETLATVNDGQISKNTQQINKLSEEIQTLSTETQQADTIAANLKKLLGRE